MRKTTNPVGRGSRIVLLSFLVPVSLVVFAGCQSLRTLEFHSSKVLISSEQETQIGNQFAEELSQDVKPLADPAAQKWVQGLGEKLVKQSPPCSQTFEFEVTTSEEVNAFAIPGGHCYVNLGLLRMADDEAQVAAVVGHEINHVTMRHGVRSMERSVGVDQLTQLLASKSDAVGKVVAAVKDSGGVLAMRSFSREDEREADHLGVEAMYKAGYDPRAAVNFFQKLHDYEQDHGAGGSGLLDRLLATHPATEERIQDIKAEIKNFDLSKPLVLNSPEFEKVKAQLPPVQATSRQ